MDEATVLDFDNASAGHASPAQACHGRFSFAKAIERDAACQSLASSGMLVVELEGIGPSLRGRLADAIDEAVEHELAARGASGPGLTSASDRDATLSDQLFRARRIGALGIAVVLGPLRAAAGALGALEPEDSATLRFLVAATRNRPVVLLLDDRDAKTTGYAAPVPLARLLDGELAEQSTPAPPAARPPRVLMPESQPAPAMRSLVPARTSPLAPPSGSDIEACDEWALATTESPPVPGSPATSMLESRGLTRHTAGASIAERDDTWRTWTLQLIAARGPQPLPALERLFTESYVPLANAIAAGLDDPRARAAEEEFRCSFARSYAETFPTFSSTTKRPRMLLDVHADVGRMARLHGARSTRMLLVDAMRWDISRLIEERLVARLGDRAVVTDEFVLWSALPTTTMRQLETIARGVDALRSPGEMDTDAEPPRGRTAEYVRRLRVGPREVHKLDVIESRLQGARGGILRALPEIAATAADAIARHAETLAPKTLLFVFGDHGFTVDRTGAARQGGSSPEEVLVGAFALLIGDVH